jgi:uncharacterized protein with NRDE domain
MCLIFAALDAHPDYALVVAANRDEFYDRPTAPAAFWPEHPHILGGRDLRAGGTWLAIDRRGRFAAVTNYRQGEREPAVRRSRGLLVSDYLASGIGAGGYIDRVEREGAEYNGFNLLAGDGRELHWLSNREGRPRRLGAGVYGLSNHLLDTPWPKVTAGKSGFTALLGGREADLVSGLFALLSDSTQVPDNALPRTGIGIAWERLLSSAFIATAEYGTRSSTVVLVGRDGSVTFVERSFGPSGVSAGEARHAFRLEQAG